jgi:hypothetical protein
VLGPVHGELADRFAIDVQHVAAQVFEAVDGAERQAGLFGLLRVDEHRPRERLAVEHRRAGGLQRRDLGRVEDAPALDAALAHRRRDELRARVDHRERDLHGVGPQLVLAAVEPHLQRLARGVEALRHRFVGRVAQQLGPFLVGLVDLAHRRAAHEVGLVGAQREVGSTEDRPPVQQSDRRHLEAFVLHAVEQALQVLLVLAEAARVVDQENHVLDAVAVGLAQRARAARELLRAELALQRDDEHLRFARRRRLRAGTLAADLHHRPAARLEQDEGQPDPQRTGVRHHGCSMV